MLTYEDKGCQAMTYSQGRVFASSPDEAAMAIRDKHQEYQGIPRIREVFPGWFEYVFGEGEIHEGS